MGTETHHRGRPSSPPPTPLFHCTESLKQRVCAFQKSAMGTQQVPVDNTTAPPEQPVPGRVPLPWGCWPSMRLLWTHPELEGRWSQARLFLPELAGMTSPHRPVLPDGRVPALSCQRDQMSPWPISSSLGLGPYLQSRWKKAMLKHLEVCPHRELSPGTCRAFELDSNSLCIF